MQFLQKLFFVLSLALLTACGGESLGGDESSQGNVGTGSGGSGPSESVPVLSVTIDNTSISAANPATVTATLTSSGVGLGGEVVTFSSDLGVFDIESGTALTNSEGVATIGLTAGSVAGASTVTASVDIDGVDPVSVGFETAGDQVSKIVVDLALTDATTGAEVSVINATNPGKLIATVIGVNKPVIVTFTSDIGEIPIPTAITDVNNQAVVDIYAGKDLGAGTVTATLQDGSSGEQLIVVGATDLQMGGGSPFVQGQAQLSLPQISAGGTTVVSVDIVDADGVPYTLPVDVQFSSNCVNNGLALLTSPVTTSNGKASSTYLAKGCVNDDPITVSANAGGVNLTASATVNVLAADAGSLEFVSASPENISLQGVGGQESSTVIFKVLDTNGNPVSNTQVNFSLNTEVGGISLDPMSATTNGAGEVQTVVNSGSVATSVRVTASIEGSSPLISSQSSLLVVSTGIPDQDSFSLSADILNPEGWSVDGTEVVVTARLADAFNNPVPDGTAVSFTAEGGSIQPSCVTQGGKCSVVWVSQFPRPEGLELGVEGRVAQLTPHGQKYGGRATIVATAIGEESFPDSNGNGRFDESEVTAFTGTDVSGADYDLDEAFVDHNEDGVYNPQQGGSEAGGENEEFIDFNGGGNFDVADGLYNGSLCAEPAHAGCNTLEKSLNVRRDLVLVMSGSTAFHTVTTTLDSVSEEHVDYAELNNDSDDKVVVQGESSGAASIIFADIHNQPMPAGTIIKFTATVGSIVGPDSYVWPNDNSNGGREVTVAIKGEKEAKSGSLIVEVTTPSGLTTTITPVSIVVI
ncbi:Ig-like domain-containing protein [Thalassotalea mangrovi]|uniref:Big-1 domain-containing protein n=1 Tax=Thalassotalea mangrovi TaxID=2572245 RepID=A0A4U1B6E5_9GAMM|nr:invasin domain 3-containing protein [Thalassotalea mangrovi]TKB45935.1 hypothetical protein E8M12_06730 [Thalassotalea mangrovi]